MKSTTPTHSAGANAPRYDLGLNPPYQINYLVKRAGKRISASKRRITFQFGFSSADAIASGLAGVDCRGEEHEIVLVWSHITGKRQIFMNSREVHASRAAPGNSKFEYSWTITGGHSMKIIANGTSSTGEKSSCQRQFDLHLDGMSFFNFSKIYKLGNTSTERGSSERALAYSYHGVAYEARDDVKEEEEEPPMLEDNTNVDLLDTHPPSSPMVSSMTNYSPMPSLVGSTHSTSSFSTASSFDEFLPVKCNTQKSFQSVSNEIMCAYSKNTPPSPAAAYSAPSSSRALVPVSEEGMGPVAKVMKNLVNLEDITTTPVQPIMPNSPCLDTTKRGGANWSLVGRAHTLPEIRDSTAQGPTVPVRETMQAHPAQLFHPAQPALMAYQDAGAPSHGYHGAHNMGYAPTY